MYCLPSKALEVVYQRKVLWGKVLHTDEGSKYQKKCILRTNIMQVQDVKGDIRYQYQYQVSLFNVGSL